MSATISPTLVFPAATPRGGVEQAVWQALRYLGSRYPTTFVGYELDAPEDLAVSHVIPRKPAWARASLAPLGFRQAANRVMPRAEKCLSVSFGVNAPPGDVFVVNSLHRAWLAVGKPVRWRGHEIPNAVRYARPRHQMLLALERNYFTRARPRAIIAVSRTVAEQLADLYGAASESIHVIPNGFDPAVCNAARRTSLRGPLREKFGVASDTIVLLFVANELYRKGFGVLLEAVSRLADERVEIHLVGRTSLEDFSDRIAEFGLTNRVRHHGTTTDIGRYHAIADVLVLPTQYEAFALTVVEALASGLPVVTTAVPGAGDLITPGVNGLLQENPTDPEELMALLSQSLDESTRAAWAMNAPLAVNGFDWGTLMRRYEMVIRANA